MKFGVVHRVPGNDVVEDVRQRTTTLTNTHDICLSFQRHEQTTLRLFLISITITLCPRHITNSSNSNESTSRRNSNYPQTASLSAATMSVTQEREFSNVGECKQAAYKIAEFAYVFEEVCKAEDPVRLENPEFITGFHAISMQGHRLDFTINRLSDVKKNLKDSENTILVNMSKLRTANPDKEPKGTNWTKRMLKDKPLWQKVVSAHTIDDNNKENIDPNLSYGGDDDNLALLSQTLKAMSAKDAKIEVENHDYTVSNILVRQLPLIT